MAAVRWKARYPAAAFPGGRTAGRAAAKAV
jgi:hypothetical protein